MWIFIGILAIGFFLGYISTESRWRHSARDRYGIYSWGDTFRVLTQREYDDIYGFLEANRRMRAITALRNTPPKKPRENEPVYG